MKTWNGAGVPPKCSSHGFLENWLGRLVFIWPYLGLSQCERSFLMVLPKIISDNCLLLQQPEAIISGANNNKLTKKKELGNEMRIGNFEKLQYISGIYKATCMCKAVYVCMCTCLGETWECPKCSPLADQQPLCKQWGPKWSNNLSVVGMP